MNIKKRGNRIELETAKLLTKITGTQFHRVGVCSGSRHTSQGINANGFVGDLFTEDKKYEGLIFEVKGTKKTISITDIFNHKSLLWQYIDQCKRECNSQDWLLLVKMSGRDTFFICEDNTTLISDGVINPNHNRDVISKYPDIFKNSVAMQFGSWWLGLLK